MYLINVRSFIYKCTKKFHHHVCVLSINILMRKIKSSLSSSNVQVPHKQTIILHVKSSRFSLAFSLISPWQWHPGFKYPYLTCHIKISRCCCRVQMRLWTKTQRLAIYPWKLFHAAIGHLCALCFSRVYIEQDKKGGGKREERK